MNAERSLAVISDSDLDDLFAGSLARLAEYFVDGLGKKWLRLYDIRRPLAAALCQGAAMHYYDKSNGVKDFDVWFFYPFTETHLPYRTIWNWDYTNPKFGHRTADAGYAGRRVDVLVRSIHVTGAGPVEAVQSYLASGASSSAKALSQKAVVMLHPESERGSVIWYRNKI